MSALNQEYFKLCHNLCMLELSRQKIEGRGFQPFDKEDIMGELGNLQHRLNGMLRTLDSIAIDLKT